MLLTITSTHPQADDLTYLLHKHPARCQSFPLPFGQAHVFYPELSPTRCTAALLLDVDPIGLVRERKGAGFALRNYVNDRPYVASSFLSVAIARVYGSALNGRCKERPALVEQALPLEAWLPALPCRGGERVLRNLFEPLGYEVQIESFPLDPQFPDWGQSRIYSVRLRAELRLAHLLTQLYVLIPVLDDDKHYYVGEAEVEKLLQRGEGWLSMHPEFRFITQRYLSHRRSLTRQAIERLLDEDETAQTDLEQSDREEQIVERPLSLNQQRLEAVLSTIKTSGARRVLDLGCGEGQLLQLLIGDAQFEEIVGLDVSHLALEKAAWRLKLDRMPPKQRERLQLIQGALTYRDDRLAGYDAAALVEVIEHLDPPRLKAFERAIFGFARPQVVVITTPNLEYNARFETLPAGALRHSDHRFEWTQDECQSWAAEVAAQYGYQVRFMPVGDQDSELGSPTQMVVFQHA